MREEDRGPTTSAIPLVTPTIKAYQICERFLHLREYIGGHDGILIVDAKENTRESLVISYQ